jgi:Holliday junction resolvase RusA-like endonuclease
VNALRFHIPGEPVAKARARSTSSGLHYTPAKTAAYEKLVAWHAKAAMGASSPIPGPVAVFLQAVYTVPASWRGKRSKDVVGQFKASRPDLDNIVKSVFDGMNGVVWNDDAQVCELRAEKSYGLVAGVTVEVVAQ